MLVMLGVLFVEDAFSLVGIAPFLSIGRAPA